MTIVFEKLRGVRFGRMCIVLAAALLGIVAARADSVVVFNEVQYHPPEPDEPEWVELHNQMAVDVDLSGWRLRGGADFDFPSGTVVPAGGYLLLSSDPASFGLRSLGPWAGRLANGGERLSLRNNSGRLMDELDFGDRGEWPIGPDGSGATLAKADEESASGEARNWRASAQLGGTPGVPNFPDSNSEPDEIVVVPLGATWRYNESGVELDGNWASVPHPVGSDAWSAGPALLGFEASPELLPDLLRTTFADPLGNEVVTYYFETDFELSAEQVANADTLLLRHVVDDGAVFYLNGVEAGSRFNMSPGAISADTTSSGTVRNAEYLGPFELSATPLVSGTNRLSVEVHQQMPQSSDVIFGAQLSMTQKRPGAVPLIISELSGTNDATFTVEIANPSEERISVGGMVLASRGAVDAFFSLPASAAIEGGGFIVLDEGSLGFRPADGDRLFLYSADGGVLIDAARADDLPRAWSEEHQKMLVPARATFGESNSFALHRDVVINEIMYHFREDPGVEGREAVVATDELIGIDAAWRYNESGAELPGAWSTMSHPVDGGAWRLGAAPIGFEFGTIPEAIRTPLASPIENSIVTYYFERDFTVTAEQLAGSLHLELWHLIDDGAVFYLNGVEVERYNLPGGPVGASTVATTAIRDAVLEGPVTLPADNLVAGTNRLSVELHQSSPTSSDVLFAAVLHAVTELEPGRDAQPIVERDEEWIELFNKGSTEVDLTGWSIDGGIDFDFPDGTRLAAGDYLVVANHADELISKYPELESKIVGDFRNGLSNSRDLIRLEDALENPVDEVRYVEGGAWPDLADGNGSSLELRDPDADNGNPRAWAASDERSKQGWQTVTYRDDGGQSYGLTNWNEFRLGMLRAGEVLVDDVSVVRDPEGAAEELIQNGSFSTGSQRWRIIGNHRHSEVITEPGNPGNRVLHLIATGATDTRHNHLETTLVDNTRLDQRQVYEVSFRARWLAGSNQVNTRCYYQRLARTTQLDRPERCGTPGAANSQLVSNLGPTYSDLRHEPAVPEPGAPTTIKARVTDPDGLGDLMLKARYDEGAVRSFDFPVDAQGMGQAILPGADTGTIIQFWIEGADSLGATMMAPAKGPDSRALIQVDDGQGSGLPTQEMRLIMLPSDHAFQLDTFNLMSNERLGGTAIYNRRVITYDAGIRLRGSGAGRARDGTVHRSFSVAFPDDQLFRGAHGSVAIDRSGRAPAQRRQDEIYVKHMFNHAGVPCMYDDLVYLIGPSSTYTGTALMQMASYGGDFMSTQFEDGDRGSIYNVDITYDPVTSSGGVEGLKPPVPFTHIGTDFEDRGDSKEDYRTSFQIRTGRRRDDYATLIAFCKTMSLPPPELDARIDSVMEVDAWMRYVALTVLSGIGDTWVQGGLRHNIRLFAPPKGSGGVVALPWDGDILFSGSTSASMFPSTGNLRRVMELPRIQRLYWGHVQDLVNRTFNADYMSDWLDHYGTVMGANLSGQVSFIRARGSYALSQLPAEVPFRIVTNGGTDFSVRGTETKLEGEGWINVREIRLAGRPDPLPVTWLDGETWQVTVPLRPGANELDLEVYDFGGELIETASLVVTSTVTEPQPVDFLRITEINYNPSGSDETEFVELKNLGTMPLQIGGVHFEDGFDFAFPATSVLEPGGFTLVVRNRGAFEARYGTGLPVAGEFAPDALDNDGERIELRDASGNVIHSFTFSDRWHPATDGAGHTLVIRDAHGDLSLWDSAEGWVVSSGLGGSPNRDDVGFSERWEVWQDTHFSLAERNTPAISGPLGDANDDRLVNLLHYAAGVSPWQQRPREWFSRVEAVDGRLLLHVRVAKGAGDLEVRAEFGSDLTGWQEVSTPLGPALDHGDGTESLRFEDPGPAGERRFARYHVTLQAP